MNKDAIQRMDKCISAFEDELDKIRTGRAHPSLLDHIKVNYFGSPTPLNQTASIATENVRMLAVTPWDKSMLADIEKAIRTSNLDVNPLTAGNVIRVPLPAPTEERRKELVKILKEKSEHAKVSIRNIRRDINNDLKSALKNKEITEDDERREQDQVQKTTDKYIEKIDQLLKIKESEVMEV